ncbi:MAG: hypothetical protein HY216_09660 [Candidatus Rokubacteria bacterium]|nr:hypothetical protein [Candidatus Rokubacteria bacterium]
MTALFVHGVPDTEHVWHRLIYAGPRWGHRLAERTGARFVSYPGCSHWSLQRPEEVAAERAALWA